MISIRTVSGSSFSKPYLNMFLLRSMKTLDIGRGRKKSPVQAFYQICKNAVCHEDSVWYYCTICHPEEPHNVSELMKGVVIYTRINTSSVRKNFMSTHPREHKAFTMFYYGKMRHER